MSGQPLVRMAQRRPNGARVVAMPINGGGVFCPFLYGGRYWRQAEIGVHLALGAENTPIS